MSSSAATSPRHSSPAINLLPSFFDYVSFVLPAKLLFVFNKLFLKKNFRNKLKFNSNLYFIKIIDNLQICSFISNHRLLLFDIIINMKKFFHNIYFIINLQIKNTKKIKMFH